MESASLRQTSSPLPEEMADIETKPLLSKFLSFPITAGTSNQQRRRRVAAKIGSAPRPSRQQSFGRDIGHAAKETYLVTSLSFTLLQYLGYFFFNSNRLMLDECLDLILSQTWSAEKLTYKETERK